MNLGGLGSRRMWVGGIWWGHDQIYCMGKQFFQLNTFLKDVGLD